MQMYKKNDKLTIYSLIKVVSCRLKRDKYVVALFGGCMFSTAVLGFVSCSQVIRMACRDGVLPVFLPVV